MFSESSKLHLHNLVFALVLQHSEYFVLAVRNTHVNLILQVVKQLKKSTVAIIALSISSLTDALKESVSVIDPS